MKILSLLALLASLTVQASTTILNRRIAPGQNLAKALYDANLDAGTVEGIISALDDIV